METRFFQSRQSVLERCRELGKGVLLLIAPTGSGKTTGMRRLIQEESATFGSTYLVQPTRMAMHSSMTSRGIVSLTPLSVIDMYLRRGTLPCRTFVLDEVHTRSVEYETILWILSTQGFAQKMRIILLTATADTEYLSRFFETISSMELPIQSPFPVEMEYRPGWNHLVTSPHQMIPMIEKDLIRHVHHDKILVFLSTHEQCDKLAKECKLSAQKHGWQTRPLYGGFTTEDYKEWEDFQKTAPRFILFATNVAETSITIPGLSLILDFGIHCIQQQNRIVYEYCPKANLIQRAGRTGRTCPGKVIRYMSEEAYEELPFQTEPEHNWDLMMLRFLRFRADASILPISCEAIMEKFRFYGVLGEGDRLDEAMARFITQSPLLFKHSVYLYRFLRMPSHHRDPVFLYFVMALAVIDIFEARLVRSYYYSPDLKISRARFLDRLKATFVERPDELELQLNLFCSCMLSEDPFEFAKAFSLNFRTFRQIQNHIQKVLRYTTSSLQKDIPDWKSAMRESHSFTLSSKRGLNDKRWDVRHLKRDVMSDIQRIFFRMEIIPRMTRGGLFLRPDFIPDFRHCIVQPRTTIKGVLLFTIDDPETPIREWIDPQTLLQEPVYVQSNMFTLFPGDLQLHLSKLSEQIVDRHEERMYIRREKERVRRRFRPVLEDVEEDIAFRPFQWKMEKSIHDLFLFVDKWMS